MAQDSKNDNPEFKGMSNEPYQNSPQDRPPGETTYGDVDAGYIDSDGGERELSKDQITEAWLVQKAVSIFTTSTDYLDANITNTWEVNLAHFHGEHGPTTAYARKNWKRSRVFRPKTRSMIKQQEAALAVAAFASAEYVDIAAEDARNDEQRISASINKNILQYRLDRRMRWFQTVMGAWQDTKNYGLCITHQYWRYREDQDFEVAFENGEMVRDDDGTPMGVMVPTVIEDEMVCDNVPPENFRFDPMCDWRDPAGTSPYIIFQLPIYAGEALERMETIQPGTNEPIWRKHSLGSLLSTRRKNYDRTRQAREGNRRIDPADEQKGTEYTMLWAHLNIIQHKGVDMAWWTMGTELLLTDWMPLSEMYPHLKPGQRPFRVGYSSIETHRNYPSGDNEQASGLQIEINDVANQRLDNVKLVLNKRYYVRRGGQVDLEALVRNIPGGGVMMNDPEKDVKTVDTRDVTGSSYQEQDRLSLEMDGLVGSFSQDSVQNQGNIGNNVGSTNMVSASATAVQDYGIRIFMETWMEPVLRDFINLIQFYETDDNVVALAANNSDLWQKYGMNQVTDDLLNQDLTVRINIGLGNTDPIRRVEKLVFAVTKSAELPGMAARIKSSNVSSEIFATLGYKSSDRFFMTDDEFAEDQKANPPQTPPDLALKQEELRIREDDNKARDVRENAKMASSEKIEMERIRTGYQSKDDATMAGIGANKDKDATIRDVAATKEANRLAEVMMEPTPGGTNA